MKHYILIPRINTVKGGLFLIGVILALSLGLALTSPALGKALLQTGSGDITGTVTVGGQGIGGIQVELHQRTNGGSDSLLAPATTDATGVYHFANQPSAPNDAFYYIRFSGGKNTLASWYSFPIIYINGSAITVPGVELADVELIEPGQNVTMAVPGSIRWKARKSGETYRLFIYAEGKNDKAIIDSGSLGTGTEFPLSEGGLPDGKYEAVVQVRDAVAGYGQSQSRFHFTIGAPAPAQPQANASDKTSPAQDVQKDQSTQTDSAAQPQQSTAPDAGKPELRVDLSADKLTIGPGGGMVYKLEVHNAGAATASGVILTDKLPAGVNVDPQTIKASAGKVNVDGSTVTVNIGELASGSKTTVEIPVSVRNDAGSNLSNQASAVSDGVSEPVQSNAYIAQVTAPVSGPPESQQQPVQQPPASQPQNVPAQPAAPQNTANQGQASAPSTGSANQAAAPAQKEAAQPSSPPKKQAASVPQTGGSFPIALAVLLLVVMLMARYVRGMKLRTER